jgi:hypothetical protein
MILNCELESAFNELTTQIEDVFAGKQGHQSAKKYLTGLLSQTKRKNNWQIAETLGETTPTPSNNSYTEDDTAQTNSKTTSKHT